MKKLLVLLFLISYQISAQTGKGSYLVGGNGTLSIATSKNKGSNASSGSRSFSLSPKVGTFLIDNLCLGVAIPLSISRSSVSNGAVPDVKSKSIGVGPFVRYYVPLKKFSFISEVGYSYNIAKSIQEGVIGLDGDAESKTISKEIQVASGFGMAISDHVMVELLLNFRHGDYESESDFTFDADVDSERNILFISVGFQFYIPKK